MSRQSSNRYTLALTELYIPIKHGVLEKTIPPFIQSIYDY